MSSPLLSALHAFFIDSSQPPYEADSRIILILHMNWGLEKESSLTVYTIVDGRTEIQTQLCLTLEARIIQLAIFN